MKSDNKKEKKVKVPVDGNLKKYVGKNLSEKKSAAFRENIEQIKAALTKNANVPVR